MGESPGSYAVGIVNYRSYDDVVTCLESVAAQTCAPRLAVVVDGDSEPTKRDAAQAAHAAAHPELETLWAPTPNRGYAGGANEVLARIARHAPESDYALILTPDVRLDPAFSASMFAEMDRRPEAALGSGLLLREGGAQVDSAGIRLPAHRRPRDRASQMPAPGPFQETEFVFGASGAAMAIRRAALEDLAIEGEVFDEDFFLYHEDTDLSWRANRVGWRVLYVPAARAVHRREWQRARRFDMAPEVRRHSFKNHYLQIIKNERARDLFLHLPVLAGWEVLRLAFALLRDREMLPAYRDAWRLRGSALHKRRIVQQRARRAESLE